MTFWRLLLLAILLGGFVWFRHSNLFYFSAKRQQDTQSSSKLETLTPLKPQTFLQTTTSQVKQVINTQANHLLQSDFVQTQAENLKSKLEDLTQQESTKVKYQIKYQFCQDVVKAELEKRGCHE